MQPERWAAVKDLFDAVADLDEVERSRLLKASDPDIRQEVERLLACADSAGDFLQEPAIPSQELLDLASSGVGAFHEDQVLLHRFRIIRLLGRGGMGEVYEAFDTHLGERVAIKTIRRDLAADQAIRERFRREVQHSRKVTHPNVCRIYDLFTVEADDGLQLPFFTMELLPGSTLRERIQANGALPLSVAAGVAFQICNGLSCAHKSGVVHRDLKSGNVLLVNEEAGSVAGRAVITDFGLAQIAPADTGAPQTRTTTRGPAGTPAYMAPELLEGRPATAASDIYALGVLLYEMVTGEYPFVADSELVALTMRLRVPPRPVRSLAPDLPSHWERAILMCLAVSSEKRIRSADEVAKLLSGSGMAKLRANLPSLRSLHLGRRELLAGSGMVACAGLASFGVWKWRTVRPERVRLLVEEFETPADLASLGRAARYLVRTALAQSPRIQLLHDDATRVEIERRQADTGLSGETALNIARSTNAAFTVGARLEKQGSETALGLWLIDVGSGRRISVGNGKVSGRGLEEDIDRLCLQLRRALAEDEESIRMHRRPLEQADTVNLAALELFTRAMECYHQGDTEPALRLLESATREDPEFAMAYVYQALIHSALRREDRALAPAVQAFKLRHRVNERQRLQAESLYHTMTGDYGRASTLNRVLAEHYPTEAQVHRHAAHTYALLDRLDEASKFAHRSVELDPHNPSNHVLLAGVLAQSNQADRAMEAIRSATKQVGEHALLDSGIGFALLVKGDSEGAMRAFSRLGQGRPDLKKMARGYQERCLILAGRLDEAREDLASQLSVDDGQQDYAYGDLRRYWLGQLFVVAGDHRKAAESTQTLCQRLPIPPFLFALRSAAELAFEARNAPILENATAKLESIQREYPSGRSQGIYYQARGLSAALEGDWTSARRDLTSARNAWPDVNSLFFAAEVQRRAGALQEAANLYERVVAAKGSALRREGVVLWVRSLAGAGLCACDLKQSKIALQRLEQFLQHWGNNPKLPIVERTRLQASSCG